MEKKILKVVTTFCGCLTVLACVCLYFFPGMKETMAAEPEIGIVPEEKVREKKQRVRVLNSKDAVITPEDIRESKKFAWLAYILFFIPLLINRDNAYVRHNANEGLEMNICDLLAGIVILLNTFLNVSNVLVSFFLMLGSIVGIGVLVLTTITKLYMIFAVLLGKVANTPWFWSIRMIR